MIAPTVMSGVPGGGTAALPLPVHAIESPPAIDPRGNCTLVPGSIVKTRVPSDASEGLGGAGKGSNSGSRLMKSIEMTAAATKADAPATIRTFLLIHLIVRSLCTVGKGQAERG